jgi:hypothetical protein
MPTSGYNDLCRMGVEGLIDKPQRRGWNKQRRPDLADQDDADIIF